MSNFMQAWIGHGGLWIIGAIDLLFISYCVWAIYRMLARSSLALSTSKNHDLAKPASVISK